MQTSAGRRSRYPTHGAGGVELGHYLDLARALRRDGDLVQARRVLERAVAAAAANGAADPVESVTARRMLSEVLHELGDVADAYRLASSLVTEAERALGVGHPATVHVAAVLGAVAHQLGEFDTAERMYRGVSAVASRAGGATRRSASLARVRLALLRRDRGQLDEARVELAAAFQAHREAYGTEDVDAVHICTQLAEMHHAAGDTAAARRVLTIAYAGALSGFGAGDPLTRRIEHLLVDIEPPMPSAPVDLPGDAYSRMLERRHDARRHKPTRRPDGLGGASGSPGAGGRSGRRSARRSARLSRAAVAAAIAVALGFTAVGAVAVVRSARGPGVPLGLLSDDPATPVAGGGSTHLGYPRDVALDDEGTTVTVHWRMDASAPAVVAILEVPDVRPRVLAIVPAGTVEYVVGGLNQEHDYCFVVTPVDPSETGTPETGTDETGAGVATATACTARAVGTVGTATLPEAGSRAGSVARPTAAIRR